MMFCSCDPLFRAVFCCSAAAFAAAPAAAVLLASVLAGAAALDYYQKHLVLALSESKLCLICVYAIFV